MRSAVMLVLVGVLLVGGCGGGEEGASETSVQSEPVEIRTSVVGAATPGAEPIATGEVVEGSTLGGSRFCVGGTILDTHGSPDPEVALIARTITCPEGSVRMDITPEVSQVMPQDLTQTGSWTTVSGTGGFEGLRGERGDGDRVRPRPQRSGARHVHRDGHTLTQATRRPRRRQPHCSRGTEWRAAYAKAGRGRSRSDFTR